MAERRYFIKAANWVAPRDEEMGRDTPPKADAVSVQVFEPENHATETGVLDADGNMIMRSDRAKIGFL